MPQFSGHWYSARAARLVAFEAGLVGAALWATGRHVQNPRALTTLIAAAACIPAALYLGDLYNPQIMRNDRGRGGRAVKALGFAALAAALFGLVGGGAGLPRGALVDTIGIAALGVLLARVILVARADEDGHSRVLIIGTGTRARETAKLIQSEAFGEYEVAGTIDPAVDLGVPSSGEAPELRRAVGAELLKGAAGPAANGITGAQVVQAAAEAHAQASAQATAAQQATVVPASSLLIAPSEASVSRVEAGSYRLDAIAREGNARPGEAASALRLEMAALLDAPTRPTAAAGPAAQAVLEPQGASILSLPSATASVVVPARTLHDAVRHYRADTVVIATDEQRSRLPIEELIRLRLEGVTVLPAHRFAERALRRVPLALLRPSDLAFGQRLTSPLGAAAKRLFDIGTSLLLLLCAAPILVVLAVLVKLDSEGPVFYSQERIGRGGKPYPIHKIRTMRKDAEKLSGPVWASQRDPRVTRLGAFLRKTRLDEIPQVFAVLRGDMSFVGPRPERQFFVNQLKQQIPFYGLREAVKPGITGWAQIRYPYGATVEDSKNKLEFDLYYVEHQSLFLDLAICFHTAKTVLFRRGAR